MQLQVNVVPVDPGNIEFDISEQFETPEFIDYLADLVSRDGDGLSFLKPGIRLYSLLVVTLQPCHLKTRKDILFSVLV